MSQMVNSLENQSHSKIWGKNHGQICHELGREMIFTLISALNHTYELI